MPALFAVGLQSPFAGDAGDSAAIFTGGIALNTTLPTQDGKALVEAATPTAAISAALVNTVTASVGNQTASYQPGPNTVGMSVAAHLPFVVTTTANPGQFTLKLEDQALMPGQTPDWDYNDRSWTVTITPVVDPPLVAPVLPPIGSGDPTDPGAVVVVPAPDPATPSVPPVPATPSQPGPYPTPPTDPAPTTGTIHGWAWNDGASADGIQQSSEPVLNGVGVWLYSVTSGTFVARTWTNNVGEYQFTGLATGQYQVVFKAPMPAAYTLYRQGIDPTADSEVATANTVGYGYTSAVALTPTTLTLWDITAGFILGADPKEVPTINLSVAGLDDKDKAKAPGKKIHINDNFDEGQKSQQSLVSDNLVDPNSGKHQVKTGDADLVSATLKLKSGVKDWRLTWTVDPKVKVWYKGWNGNDAGKWLEVPGNHAFYGIDVPATIDLMLEGMEVGKGTVKVELSVNDEPAKVADEVAFTVYTGLKLTGTKATDALRQLEKATGWTLKKTDAGEVWRTGGALMPEQWRQDAQSAMGPILLSDKQTAVGAENKKEIVGGSWALKEIDPGDYAAFFTADERFGSGTHLSTSSSSSTTDKFWERTTKTPTTRLSWSKRKSWPGAAIGRTQLPPSRMSPKSSR